MDEVEDAQERVREAVAAQQEARAKKAATRAAYDDALAEEAKEGKRLVGAGSQERWFYEVRVTEKKTRWLEVHSEEGAHICADREMSTGRIRQISTRAIVTNDKITVATKPEEFVAPKYEDGSDYFGLDLEEAHDNWLREQKR